MKKIMILAALTILMLVAISFSSATDSRAYLKKKESPLYKIRTKQSINEDIGDIIEFIKIKFLGGRIFFQPIKNFRGQNTNIGKFTETETFCFYCPTGSIKCPTYKMCY